MIKLDYGDTPDKLKGEYIDIYDGVRSEVLCTTKFDENSDLSTAYVGRTGMIRSHNMKSGRKISYIRTMVYSRETVRWYRM